MKFEDVLGKKIDMSKVKVDVLKPWITKRTTEMLKIEDDVVVEFIFNQLEEKVSFIRYSVVQTLG
jgi:serine/arginine repetitive matrix protein 1